MRNTKYDEIKVKGGKSTEAEKGGGEKKESTKVVTGEVKMGKRGWKERIGK